MRHAVKAVIGALALVLVLVVGLAWATSNPEPAQAQGEGCIINIQGTLGIVICGGEIIGQLPLPTVSVKGPTVTLPPITELVPGPRETVTVRPPAETRTVTEPGDPGATVTEQVPGETETVTRSARPEERTETATPEATETVSPSGQSESPDDKVEPDEPDAIDFDDGEATVVEVGLGVLAVLALMAIILAALFIGYYLGYKGGEQANTRWMRALLERSKIRR